MIPSGLTTQSQKILEQIQGHAGGSDTSMFEDTSVTQEVDVEMPDWVDEEDGAGAFTTAMRDLLDPSYVAPLLL